MTDNFFYTPPRYEPHIIRSVRFAEGPWGGWCIDFTDGSGFPLSGLPVQMAGTHLPKSLRPEFEKRYKQAYFDKYGFELRLDPEKFYYEGI